MLPEAEEVEIRQGLVQEAMSPEISEEEDAEHDDLCSENEDVGVKKIFRRPLSWRNERFTNILNSLDRKWLQKCSAKARSLVKKRYVGACTLTKQVQDDMPNWMRR